MRKRIISKERKKRIANANRERENNCEVEPKTLSMFPLKRTGYRQLHQIISLRHQIQIDTLRSGRLSKPVPNGRDSLADALPTAADCRRVFGCGSFFLARMVLLSIQQQQRQQKATLCRRSVGWLVGCFSSWPSARSLLDAAY